MAKRGIFISLEGGEGAGKSTAIQFLREQLDYAQIPYVSTREPGGTLIAEDIRKILLKHYQEPLFPVSELLLMFAGRAQHVETVIKPMLAAGKWVITDRYVDASFAYQGGGRGIPDQWIQQLITWTTGNLQPNLTIILDIPVDVGLQRMRIREVKDRIESEEEAFFQRVREVYLGRAATEPKRIHIVNAEKSLMEVHRQILNLIKPFIDEYQHVG